MRVSEVRSLTSRVSVVIDKRRAAARYGPWRYYNVMDGISYCHSLLFKPLLTLSDGLAW